MRPDRTEVLLLEYKTLRDEVHVTMDNRNQVLSFGMVAIGLVIGGALSFEEKAPQATMWALSAVVPLLAVFVLALWLAERARMMRASKHLVEVEAKINTIFGEPLLTWEANRRSSRDRSDDAIDSLWWVAVPFAAILSAAPIAGFQITHQRFESYWYNTVPWGLVVWVCLVAVFGCIEKATKQSGDGAGRNTDSSAVVVERPSDDAVNARASTTHPKNA